MSALWLNAPRRLVQVQRAQWLSHQRLSRLEWTRFEKILRHAFECSPFYRTKFKEAGITPADIRSRADLERIPITTREELSDGERFIADGWSKNALHVSLSSGSSGTTVTTYFDAEAWLVGKFLIKLRARFACGVRPWDRIAIFQAGNLQQGTVPDEGTVGRLLLRRRYFSIHDSLAQVAPPLCRFKPTVLYGPPSYLRELAEKAPAGLHPSVIFTSGELLEGDTRSVIEESFEVPVYDVYGCTELKEIAWECPERRGYHVNADWLLIESAELPWDKKGPGKGFLVTSLFNYAMPLIRYDVGDSGTILEGDCPCGRTFPMIRPSLGRIVDYFQLPSGDLVSPYTMVNQLEAVQGVSQFQIIQEALERVVVRVKPDQHFQANVLPRIRSILGPILPGVSIEVEPVGSIEREPSGKYRLVVSKLDRRNQDRVQI